MPDDSMTPDARLLFVADQIIAVEQGKSDILACPYCKALNRTGQPLCCDLFRHAAVAALAATAER